MEKSTPNYGIILKASPEREASVTQHFLVQYNSYNAVENFPVVKVVYYYNRAGEYYNGNKSASSTSYAGKQYTNISFPYEQNDGTAVIDWGDMLVGGNSTNGGPYRSYVAFDLSSLPKNISITAASVDMYMYAKFAQGTTINMHILESEWGQTGVSWVSRTADTLWSAAGGDYNPVVEGAVTFVNNPNVQYYTFNITRSWILSQWIDGIIPNAGFMFKSSAENANDRGYFFYGFDISARTAITGDPAAYMPRLNITFNAAPGFTPPEIISPKAGDTTDGIHIINWRQGSQSSLGDPLNLTYHLEYSDNGGTNWYSIGSTAAKASTYNWDTTALGNGTDYMVRIRAHDGTVYSDYAGSGVFEIAHADTNLKILSSVVSPSTLQAGENITVVMNIANTYLSESYTIVPSELTVNNVSGGGAVPVVLNSQAVIAPCSNGYFTWVYRTTEAGTINFSAIVAAYGGDGNSGINHETVDTNSLTHTSKHTGSDIVILYSTPSETPTFTYTPTHTPTQISCDGLQPAGRTGMGASAYTGVSGRIKATRFHMPEDGYVKKLVLGIGLLPGAVNGRMALYTDNAGVPGNLIAESDSKQLELGVYEFDIPETELAKGVYWTAFNLDGAADVHYSAAT